MKTKRFAALLLTGAMLLALGACKAKEKENASSSEPPEVIDPNYPVAVGDIRVPERPDTVVSLSPALTEVICELGASDRLGGVSDFCDYPEEAAGLTPCGTPQLPNLEEIKSISPQVVFASSALSQADTVQLQQMGAEVVVLPRADSIDALETLYVTAGTVLDGMEEGGRNGRDTFAPLRAKYDAIVYAGRGIADRLSGVWLRAAPLMMATGDTFEGELLEAIGIENSAAEFTGWEYPADKAVDLYPDVIFYDETVDVDYLKTNQVYNTTDAVKQGRIYPFNAVAFERQSAPMFDELEKMFRSAYPDAELAVSAPPDTAEPETESRADSKADGDDEVLSLDDATQIQ